jgi:hypothetical protein
MAAKRRHVWQVTSATSLLRTTVPACLPQTTCELVGRVM